MDLREQALYKASQYARLEVLSLLPLIEQRIDRAKADPYDIEVLLTMKKYITILLDLPEERPSLTASDSLMLYTGTFPIE